VCIDWEQRNTGNCHQNADLQKVEQAVVKSARSRQYGFVDAVPQRCWIADRCCSSGNTEASGRAFVSPWELSPHGTRVHKAALRHVDRWEKAGLHYGNSLSQSTNKCSLNTLRLHPRSPSLQLFATGAKLLQKGAKVKIPPSETNISISSQFTGVSLPLKVSRYSSSRLGLDWHHQ